MREFSVFGVFEVENNATPPPHPKKAQCWVAVDCPDAASGKKAFPNNMVDDYFSSLLLLHAVHLSVSLGLNQAI